MKKIIAFLLFVVAALAVYGSNPLRIGVITDTHYLSEQLMDKGYAAQDFVYNSGRNIIASPEILDKVIKDYMESNIDVLLVCGDITKDGEKQSHIDFREKLKPLHNKGVKIFVVPGNHDVNISKPIRFQGNKIFDTEGIGDKDFEEIYADYGYKSAVNRHIGSLSYAAPLDDSTLLLAIDATKYNPSRGKNLTAGVITPKLRDWIEFVIDGFTGQRYKRIVAMMHWGVVEHMPMQGQFFEDYLVSDYKEVATFLANSGIQLIFTGHFHSNDISSFTTEQGNTIYDVETGALISYPFTYRFVELGVDKAVISTKNITSVPSEEDLVENSKKTMKRIATQLALPILKKKNKIFTEQELEQFAEIAGDLYLLHLAGDEKVPDSIAKSIVEIFEKKEFPVDETVNDMELDFPPLDNNITIELK